MKCHTVHILFHICIRMCVIKSLENVAWLNVVPCLFLLVYDTISFCRACAFASLYSRVRCTMIYDNKLHKHNAKIVKKWKEKKNEKMK